MTQKYTQSDFETVYEVFHRAEHGFHGNTSIYVAVLNEDDDVIEGREFSPMHEQPGERVVIQKSNVAGWKEDSYQLNKLPSGPTF